MNRTVFKRLGDKVRYRLTKDSRPFDKEILVDNGADMFIPKMQIQSGCVVYKWRAY